MHALFALLASLAAAIAFADPKPLSTEEGLSQWMTHYYQRPEPARLPEALLAASKLGAFRGGKAVPPFFGFVAGVLAREPSLSSSLIERLGDLPGTDHPVVILGIRYSGHPDTRKLLATIANRFPGDQSMIDAFGQGSAPRLTDIPLEQGPWVLDALWGNFMATGDDAPVIRIMSALPWVEIRGNVPKLMAGGSARWSLVSNAVQHPRVLDICRAQLKVQPKEVAIVLGGVISQAEKDIASRDASTSNSSLERTK